MFVQVAQFQPVCTTSLDMFCQAARNRSKAYSFLPKCPFYISVHVTPDREFPQFQSSSFQSLCSILNVKTRESYGYYLTLSQDWKQAKQLSWKLKIHLATPIKLLYTFTDEEQDTVMNFRGLFPPAFRLC